VPRHQVTADELVRGCAPAAPIALVNWTPGEQRYGPLIKARERLEGDGTWARCRAELRQLFLSHDEATDGTFDAPSEYLVVTARRR
jgi:hypothetical protein